MICHVCGGELQATVSDMPFKLEANRIVILNGLPVLQCGECGDYSIVDAVMERVEMMLDGIDASAELKVVRYAA